MDVSRQQKNTSMKQAVRQIAVLAALLTLALFICRLTMFRTYTVRIPISDTMRERLEKDGVQTSVGAPHVLEVGDVRVRPGYVSLQIHPDQAGETEIQIRDQSGEQTWNFYLHVSPLGTVYDPQTEGFSGDSALMVAFTLFWLLVSAVMTWHFFQMKGPSFYAYTTIFYAGFAIFTLVTGLVTLVVTVRHILHPERFSMFDGYSAINSASVHFMILTTPAILAFAAAMMISNIALLRHERIRLRNFLGILISLLLVAGNAIGWMLFSSDVSGSEMEVRIRNTLNNTYATVFAYFECMLAGSVICGVKAARHQPTLDRDFIVILGCWFRKDGSLPPLLRGRADRAISFWREQKESTGKEAVFIPSGGQGRDETMPEAEAIRRYLLSQGVPESAILPENRSANTYQNMAFSKEIIQDVRPDGRTVFATTNYHVFRSGIWAAQAGLTAEGIGGKTKWWFWPNAFMRECIGLLQRRWKQEVVLLVLLLAIFGLLSIIL